MNNVQIGISSAFLVSRDLMASAFVMFQNQDIVYKAMDHKQSRSLLVSCRCGGSGGSHGVHVSIGSGCRILNDPLLRESDFWVC